VIKQERFNEEISLKQKSHTQHGYGYPYSFSYKIDTKGGKIEILSKNGGSGSATLSNQIVTLIPILGKV
jgi:hypothetical protein